MENNVVYISNSGKSYSYKKTALYYIKISLKEALKRGLVQNKSKWAQKPEDLLLTTK